MSGRTEAVRDGGPAFPVTPVFEHDDSPGSPYCITDSGMSLRDYFAAHAMAGLLANPDRHGAVSEIGVAAYLTADSMLTARSTPKPTDTEGEK